MGISTKPNCLFCNELETIENIHMECPNAIHLWQETENWVKSLHYPHLKIPDTEKIFGEKYNNHFKHIIIISIKDVIHQKRKKGDKMYLQDVKKLILKNLHILKTQESLGNTLSYFDEDWKILIECFRNDPATKKQLVPNIELQNCYHTLLTKEINPYCWDLYIYNLPFDNIHVTRMRLNMFLYTFVFLDVNPWQYKNDISVF